MKNILIVIFVLLAGAVVFFFLPDVRSLIGGDAPSVGCTMEAKICPDGSAVGRTGPDCAFAVCPSS